MKRLCLILIAGCLVSCIEDQGFNAIICADEQNKPLNAISPTTFPVVSNVLEKRCGTLDCHGNIARPFRFYGQNGLRLASAAEVTDPETAQANGTVPGAKSTTQQEFDLNYRAMCGLEPEKMTQVQNGEAEASELLILRKALDNEKEDEAGEGHKGGQQFSPGGFGYSCVESFISPSIDFREEDCRTATSSL
jgi:hypothetical protein